MEHHALGGLLVSADRYCGRAEILARIETGGAAGDPLDLAARTLELFRVVSHQGRPEVWLRCRPTSGASRSAQMRASASIISGGR